MCNDTIFSVLMIPSFQGDYMKAKISITIDQDLLGKLSAAAASEFRSPSQLINLILRCFTERLEAK